MVNKTPARLARALRLSERRYTPTIHRQQERHSSVSSSEVSHFSGLAASWWDPLGSSRLLHEMNPHRHAFISRCRASVAPSPTVSPSPAASSNIDFPPPPPPQSYPPSPTPAPRTRVDYHTRQNQHYLDIGCGGGIFAETAARQPHVAGVTAIDPTPDVIRVARAHARTDPLLASKLRYVNCGIEELALPGTDGTSADGAGADVVSVFEVVEHVRDPARFLERCMAHVRPGGWLVGSTISRTWASWLTTKIVAEDVLRIVPRGTHDWAKYINPGELEAWAGARDGWGDWRTMGLVYVPGVGWREVDGSQAWGNYFFGIRRRL